MVTVAQAPPATMHAAGASPEDIKKRLERKATFEQSLADLTHAIQTCSPEQLQELLPLVTRVYTLLKARYSNISFWQQGHKLFTACQAHPLTPAAAATKLQAYITEAASFASVDQTEQPADPRPATLGELLFGITPQQAAPSHLSDAGWLLDHQPPAAAATAATAAAATTLASRGGAQAPAAAAANSGGITGDQRRSQQQQHPNQQHQHSADGSESDAEQPTTTTAAGDGSGAAAGGDGGAAAAGLEGSVQSQLLEALQGILPPEAVQQLQQDDVLLQLQALEADRLAALLAEAPPAPTPARPAAARAAVSALPTLTLTASEAGDKCPICTEEFKAGDAAQRLPCNHLFHPDCLAPWLNRDNSCPVCRKEMPTDDWRYEAKKEREQQEEEDRRGAENALSHNEFMYI